MFTNDDELVGKLRMVANHGQTKQYYHGVIGVNSRLDSIQAAILDVKLKYLDEYAYKRNMVAEFYNSEFAEIEGLQIPIYEMSSNHVFHQYTLRVKNDKRNNLKNYLAEKGIPSNIYYPLPLYEQKAFASFIPENFRLPITEMFCQEVLSLPIHTETNDKNTKTGCKSG